MHAQLLICAQLSADAMDCSPPGSSVPGISQARILEWVAIPFSRGCSQPRDQIQVSYIGRQATLPLSHFSHFTTEPPGFFSTEP